MTRPAFTAAGVLPRALELALGFALVVQAAVGAGPAFAQDFGGAGESAPLAAGPLAALDRGLPAAPGFAIEASSVRWYGIAGLTTRALAAAASLRSARVALGLSQTGDGAIGWTALGVAAGVAGDGAGAALRAVGRRDRSVAFTQRALPGDLGVEVGGGAWVAAAPGVALWASAPQLWTRGAAPPLARGLLLGVAARGAGFGAWLAREAPRGPGRLGTHEAGLAFELGPLTLAASGRDRPARAAFGVAARAPFGRVAAEVESHPVLGETARVAIGFGSFGGRDVDVGVPPLAGEAP